MNPKRKIKYFYISTSPLVYKFAKELVKNAGESGIPVFIFKRIIKEYFNGLPASLSTIQGFAYPSFADNCLGVVYNDEPTRIYTPPT